MAPCSLRRTNEHALRPLRGCSSGSRRATGRQCCGVLLRWRPPSALSPSLTSVSYRLQRSARGRARPAVRVRHLRGALCPGLGSTWSVGIVASGGHARGPSGPAHGPAGGRRLNVCESLAGRALRRGAPGTTPATVAAPLPLHCPGRRYRVCQGRGGHGSQEDAPPQATGPWGPAIRAGEPQRGSEELSRRDSLV